MRYITGIIRLTAALILFAAGPGCMDSLDEAVPPIQENSLINTIIVNGRVFYFIAPSVPTAPGGSPVVMLIHGGDGYALEWLDLGYIGFPGIVSGMAAKALARGYLVIAPESGISDEPSGSFSDVKKRWDTTVNSKDIPYFLDMINWLAHSNYFINPSRIFAAGISSGGSMISRLCQTTPGLFRRVVIEASINPNYGLIPATQTVNQDHPSVMFIQGTADPLAPYARLIEYYNALSFTVGLVNESNWNTEPLKILYTVTGGGHTWFSEYNDSILDWFDAVP